MDRGADAQEPLELAKKLPRSAELGALRVGREMKRGRSRLKSGRFVETHVAARVHVFLVSIVFLVCLWCRRLQESTRVVVID